MQAYAWETVEGVQVESVMLSGKRRAVKGIWIRWLSKVGADASGTPLYGLRHFTAEPEGEIPIHNHPYHQTVFILTGRFVCYVGNSENGEIEESRVCGPGEVVFSPAWEPHGMKNLSSTEPATFLCCIGRSDETVGSGS